MTAKSIDPREDRDSSGDPFVLLDVLLCVSLCHPNYFFAQAKRNGGFHVLLLIWNTVSPGQAGYFGSKNKKISREV